MFLIISEIYLFLFRTHVNYILNLNEYIVMEYYSISCINYCSFVNIYKCFIPKERTMFGDEF